MTLRSLLFAGRRDKCTEESHHGADAQHRWGTPRLNSSEGIKDAHKDDKTQLPETREERDGGTAAAQARRRGTPPVTSLLGDCGFNCVSFAYSAKVSGGGRPGGQGRAWQHPKGLKWTLRSLMQLVRLPNPTLKPHKAFMELTQEKKLNNMSALAISRDTLPQKSDVVELLEVPHST